ncbi:hypothetical protein WDW86_07630 [Bdellovibrionota bacterium FG-2]
MKIFFVSFFVFVGLLVTLGFEQPSFALSELRELYRGPRAQAMGNAFVAVADDEQAIFYNPAGLAGNTKTKITYLAADLEASNDLIFGVGANLGAFSKLGSDTINNVMGKDIYARATVAPSITIPGFGLAVLVDDQAALFAKNKALPHITLGYQATNGIQAGFGFALGGKKRKRRSELRVGAAGKMLWRRGGYHEIPLMDMFKINANTLGDMTGGYERGFGGDLGAQYLFDVNPHLLLSSGLAYTDILDTKFGGIADRQPSNLSTGIAATYHFKRASTTLAYDYRHMLTTTDSRKKSHLGWELSIPLISVYAGLNQMAFCYGATLDLFLFKIRALSYAEDMAAFANLESQRRYMFHIDFSLRL